MCPVSTQLRTARLLLRPTQPQDAERALAILTNWNVARNLRLVPYPIDGKANEAWFAGHGAQWVEGSAYRFAIIFDDTVIGFTDIDEICDGSGSLGYWLDEKYWGQGFAKEAAFELIRLGFEDLELRQLRSGHASDNVASGKILAALGFKYLETATIPSLSRKIDIEQRRYLLQLA